MIKKCVKITVALLITMSLLSQLLFNVSADSPYKSYVAGWWTDAPAPDAYVPVKSYTGIDLGTTEMKEPRDLHVDKETGTVYILDTANDRIIVVDKDFNFIREMKDFINDLGEEEKMRTMKLSDDQQTETAEETGAEGENTEAAPAAEGEAEAPAATTSASPMKPLEKVTIDGVEYAKTSLSGARGIYVDSGYIYIADSENHRVLKTDMDGNILLQILKPDPVKYPAYTSKTYIPNRVMVDKIGMIYVISGTVFQGAILFDESGEFDSFFGSAPVAVTAKLLADRFWKKIMPTAQRAKMAQFVPMEYTSFDIDESQFVYTCAQKVSDKSTALRKLNSQGSSVLTPPDAMDIRNSTIYGESETLFTKSTMHDTTFVDIAVDYAGYIYALDIERSRVYVYDEELRRMCTFGTTGDQLGTFKSVSALETYEDLVYVLDGGKHCITVFKLTDYGEMMRKGNDLFIQGKYSESLETWNEVAARSNNNIAAYYRIGKALQQQDKYEESIEYFKISEARGSESKSFDNIRSKFLRDNFSIVMIIALVIVVGLILITNKKFVVFLGEKRRQRRERKKL